MTDTCGWLVQRASNNPEPDFPEDCYVVGECGEAVEAGAARGLCPFHLDAMELPGWEFERIAERHDGHAFS